VGKKNKKKTRGEKRERGLTTGGPLSQEKTTSLPDTRYLVGGERMDEGVRVSKTKGEKKWE